MEMRFWVHARCKRSTQRAFRSCDCFGEKHGEEKKEEYKLGVALFLGILEDYFYYKKRRRNENEEDKF